MAGYYTPVDSGGLSGGYIPNYSNSQTNGYTGGTGAGLIPLGDVSGVQYQTEGSIPTSPQEQSTQDSLSNNINGLNGAGSGSGTGSSYNEDDLRTLERSLSNYQGLLGDVGIFQERANQNLLDSYNTNVNSANTRNARQVADFKTQRGDNRDSQNKALGGVDTNARTLINSLRRIMGQAGGANSSAYNIAAPNAVSRQASQQRNNVQSTYGRNERDLDQASLRTSEDFSTLLASLLKQRNDNQSSLNTQFATERQGINNTLSGISGDIASLKGGSAFDATQPYFNEFNRLQDQITGYASDGRTAVNADPVRDYSTNLQDYTVDRQAINANRTQQSNYSPYSQFLQRDEEERIA